MGTQVGVHTHGGGRVAFRPPHEAFLRFAVPVAGGLARVSKRIHDILEELGRTEIVSARSEELIRAPVLHLFLRDGKLMRPLLVLLSAGGAGGDTDTAEPLVRAAAAVEILHTASLAHDDIVDGSASRRGSASLHAKYGTSTAVLVGDLFYARFFQEIASLQGASADVRNELLRIFLAVTARMCQGEIIEEGIRAAGRSATMEEYLGITEAKTASLVSACCKAGAMLGGASTPAVSAMADYGRELGLLFQVADDLRDGDAAYPAEIALREMARARAEAAVTALDMIGTSAAAAMLREIPGYLLDQVTRGSALVSP